MSEYILSGTEKNPTKQTYFQIQIDAAGRRIFLVGTGMFISQEMGK